MVRFFESLILATAELVLGRPIQRVESSSAPAEEHFHVHIDLTFVVDGPLDEDDIEEAGKHLVQHLEGFLNEAWRDRRSRP